MKSSIRGKTKKGVSDYIVTIESKVVYTTHDIHS